MWFVMTSETTVAHTGQSSIPVQTTGNDKGQYTVILASMADGRKLKLYVVFKGVKPVAKLQKVPGVVVASASFMQTKL